MSKATAVTFERVKTPTQLRRAVGKAKTPVVLLLGPLERPNAAVMRIRGEHDLTDDAISTALEIAFGLGAGGALVERLVAS